MKQPLNAGDILIFQADHAFISKLIAWSTFSDVSHAAMVYGETQMVEMGLDGIMVCNFRAESSAKAETAYQLRLSPMQPTEPLLEAANRYLDAKIPYDVPALVLLGIALIYRHLHPSTLVYHLLERLLTLACVELDKLINKLLSHPDAMVCSQLVYQIYMDCGGPYQIQIKGGVLQGAADDRNGTIRLIDFISHADSISVEQIIAPETDAEALCRELYTALQQAETQNDSATPPPTSLVGKTRGLHDRMARLAKQLGVPLEALCVMPADLVYHAKNLTRVAQLPVERLDRIR